MAVVFGDFVGDPPIIDTEKHCTSVCVFGVTSPKDLTRSNQLVYDNVLLGLCCILMVDDYYCKSKMWMNERWYK